MINNQINQSQLLSFLKFVEGCKLSPYKDSGGIPTIGIGMTHYPNEIPVTMKDKPLSMDQAEEMCLQLVKSYSNVVINYVTQRLEDYQLTALISFCYNEGSQAFKTSSLLTEINIDPNNLPEIKKAFQRWIYIRNDKEILEESKGLINRRNAEFNMYSGQLEIGKN